MRECAGVRGYILEAMECGRGERLNLNGFAHDDGGQAAKELGLGVLGHDIGYHVRGWEPGDVHNLVLLVASKDVQAKADVLGGVEASAVTC